jgi:hypothetical protein
VVMSYQASTTLHTVASRLAIGDLTARYGRAYDTGDMEGWIGTFLPEGVFVLPGRDPIEGHGALRTFFKESPREVAHLTTDAIVEIDGVTARQECRVLVVKPGPQGSNGEDAHPVVRLAGCYSDELVYERGGWYFRRRTVTIDLP